MLLPSAFMRFACSPLFLFLFLCLVVTADAEESLDAPHFGREIRPILARHCFKCHGPDPETREADLRLDLEASAKEDLGGYAAVVAESPEQSELFVRVTSTDADLRMPPADSSPPLSESEVQTLRRWIQAGGKYEQHWAFVPPVAPPIPSVQHASWCRDPIDRFVLARMEGAGMEPSPEAPKVALIRRVYLDLAGLTPSPQAVDRFLADETPDAYRRMVDEVLASPDYAERFARPWLDLARYSDTNGYEKDRPRTIWPFRDWVIDAIGNDMSFDRFSIEQLAGDMLPNASNAQRIATGFHRNTMMNEEGGIDPQEYRFYSLVDRVATTGTVWMGLTTGCAQCHTHKYDPITHTDYYALLALLNNADEPDVQVEDRAIQDTLDRMRRQVREEERRLAQEFLPSYEQFLAEHGASPNGGPNPTNASRDARDDSPAPAITSGQIDGADQSITSDPDANAAKTSADRNPKPIRSIGQEFRVWLDEHRRGSRSWTRMRPSKMESTMPKLTVQSDDSILASGDVTKREVYELTFELPATDASWNAIRLEVLPDDSLPAGGPGLAFYEGRRGDFFLSELTVTRFGKPLKLVDASHSFGKISVGSGSADAANVLDGEGSTGWSTSGAEGKANQWVANFADPVPGGSEIEVELLFERHFAAGLGHFRISLSQGGQPVVASKLPAELYDWHPTPESELSENEYRTLQRTFVRTSERMKGKRKQLDRLLRSMPEPVRTLGFRERPQDNRRVTYRHHRGEYLQTREAVDPAVPSVFPGLAPDTAKDRLGLARWLVSTRNPLVARVTANRAWREFFGVGLVDTAGDFGTQSGPPSHPLLLDWLATDLREHDWSMKHLHRRIVLSATYRQSIGPAKAFDPRNRLLSVFPHRRMNAEQIRDTFLSAAGLLTRRIGGPSVYPPQPPVVHQMAYGSPRWNTSTGRDRYRRSLYTFSKRTAPFAAFATFDGPTGETCLARRERSTTPLQALTLLNDQMYLELAKGAAEASIAELPEPAAPADIATRIFRRILVRSPEPDELAAIIGFYRKRVSDGAAAEDREDGAAWTLVARALMNTDEAITTP